MKILSLNCYIYLILGVSEYFRIKIYIKSRIGKVGESIVELIILGWIMMSVGKEVGLNSD